MDMLHSVCELSGIIHSFNLTKISYMTFIT